MNGQVFFAGRGSFDYSFKPVKLVKGLQGRNSIKVDILNGLNDPVVRGVKNFKLVTFRRITVLLPGTAFPGLLFQAFQDFCRT